MKNNYIIGTNCSVGAKINWTTLKGALQQNIDLKSIIGLSKK